MNDTYFILTARDDVRPVDAPYEGLWFGPVYGAATATELGERFKDAYAAEGVAVTVHANPPSMVRPADRRVVVDERFVSGVPLRDVVEEVAGERMLLVKSNPATDQSVSIDESNRRMLMEAAEAPEREVFTFADLVEIVRGQSLAQAFRAWAVERFYEAAEAGFEFEVVEGRAIGRMMTVERPTSGWSSWSVKEFAPALAVVGEPVHIRMEKVTANDRGPSDFGPTVKFPLDVLFGERQRDERYQQFLALKAEFEGGQS